MQPPSNRTYLLKSWALLLLMVPMLLGVAWQAFARGEKVMLVALIVPIGLVIYTRTVTRTRVARLLKQSTPEPIIEFSRKSGAMTAELRLIAAGNVALFRAMWGQFERARADLELDDWSGAPDLIRAHKHWVKAMIGFVSRTELATALSDAERALRLREGPMVPGMRSALESCTTAINIGHVLRSGASPELASELEACRARIRAPAERALVDWGLGVAYRMLGRDADAEAVLARLRAAVPHCEPLHDFTLSPREQPRPGTAGACSQHPERAAIATCARCGNYACVACAHGVRAEARVCSDCHALYGEQRRTHVSTERRIRACGLPLRLVGIGLALFGLVLGAPGMNTQPFLAIACMLSALAMGFAVQRSGEALRRLEPTGAYGLPFLCLQMVVLFPLGWLFAPWLLVLRFGRKGRFVLSPEYRRIVEATPEIEGGPARGFGALLLLVLGLSTALTLYVFAAPWT